MTAALVSEGLGTSCVPAGTQAAGDESGGGLDIRSLQDHAGEPSKLRNAVAASVSGSDAVDICASKRHDAGLRESSAGA